MLLLAMKLLVRFPVAVKAHRAEIKHGLDPGFAPAHARLFHEVFDQMTASDPTA